MTAFSHNFDDLQRRVITLTFPNPLNKRDFYVSLTSTMGSLRASIARKPTSVAVRTRKMLKLMLLFGNINSSLSA
jgi:hypothetical protein